MVAIMRSRISFRRLWLLLPLVVSSLFLLCCRSRAPLDSRPLVSSFIEEVYVNDELQLSAAERTILEHPDLSKQCRPLVAYPTGKGFLEKSTLSWNLISAILIDERTTQVQRTQIITWAINNRKKLRLPADLLESIEKGHPELAPKGVTQKGVTH